MTYVITEPCIGEKNGACVDVCPASCIHTTPDAPQNYIDAAICIECEQCVLVCPVSAVFLDVELPDEWKSYIAVNADFFTQNKPPAALGREQATHMAESIRAYATTRGVTIAAACTSCASVSRTSITLPTSGARSRRPCRSAFSGRSSAGRPFSPGSPDYAPGRCSCSSCFSSSSPCGTECRCRKRPGQSRERRPKPPCASILARPRWKALGSATTRATRRPCARPERSSTTWPRRKKRRWGTSTA